MFILKHFDRPLFEFDFIHQDGEEGECTIGKIYEENRYYFPAGLRLNGRLLYIWIRARVVSLNRNLEDDVWRAFGVSMNDTVGLLKKSHILSLNDCYWASEVGSGEVFSELSLHEHIDPNNPALSPYFNYDNRRGLRRYKGKLYFYKNSEEELISELVCARLAEKMGLKFCDYVPAKYQGETCMRCEIFTDTEHSLLTISRILLYHSMKQTTKYLSGLGEDYVNAYHDMLIFDCLIYNEDRHSGNFGLILDSRTLKPLEFAPLFDHGRSFFVYRNRVKCEELIDLSKNAVNYYGVPYDDIAKEYISDRQRAQLRLALDFRIPKKYYKLFSEERIKNLEEFIHYRAKELLSF